MTELLENAKKNATKSKVFNNKHHSQKNFKLYFPLEYFTTFRYRNPLKIVQSLSLKI